MAPTGKFYLWPGCPAWIKCRFVLLWLKKFNSSTAIKLDLDLPCNRPMENVLHKNKKCSTLCSSCLDLDLSCYSLITSPVSFYSFFCRKCNISPFLKRFCNLIRLKLYFFISILFVATPVLSYVHYVHYQLATAHDGLAINKFAVNWIPQPIIHHGSRRSQ